MVSESKEELGRRLLFASLLPVVSLAVDLSTPLKALKHTAELAYYSEARGRKLKHREIMTLMGVSMPKAANLSRQLKDYFSSDAPRHDLERRIMRLLWAGPASESRIGQYLDDEKPEAISSAISALVEQGRVEPVKGPRATRYRLTTKLYRQGRESWMARLDGLSHFLRSVAQLIHKRFYSEDENSVVKTLSFRIKQSDLPALREHYDQALFPLVCRLDEAAEECPEEETVLLNLALHWSPEK